MLTFRSKTDMHTLYISETVEDPICVTSTVIHNFSETVKFLNCMTSVVTDHFRETVDVPN